MSDRLIFFFAEFWCGAGLGKRESGSAAPPRRKERENDKMCPIRGMLS